VKTKILLIIAMLAAPAAHAAFKCKDEKGVTHVGDTPPAACANVVMYEVSRSGTVLRRIDPTPTGDEVKARMEEKARAEEAAKAAAEQRRKDRALLATYSSEKDIDTSRDINLKPIEGRLKSAKDRIVVVDKRIKELETELEFYQAGKSGKSSKARQAPPQLQADYDRARAERVSLDKSLVDYEKEMQEVRTRYDTDKARWVELKQLHREGKLDLRDPKEVEAAKKSADQATGSSNKKYNIYIVPAR
jgi:hypothetical protein